MFCGCPEGSSPPARTPLLPHQTLSLRFIIRARRTAAIKPPANTSATLSDILSSCFLRLILRCCRFEFRPGCRVRRFFNDQFHSLVAFAKGFVIPIPHADDLQFVLFNQSFGSGLAYFPDKSLAPHITLAEASSCYI